MARKLFDTGIFSVIDEASAIGVGWRLSFFAANTSTPITTYNAPAGGSPNPHPVLSDAEGRFPEIWIEDGQSIKWSLANTAGEIITTVDAYAIPASPPSFAPVLDDFLAGSEPLQIEDGGTGQTGAINALTALGGLPLAGGTVTGNIVRSTKGVHLFWEIAALNSGNVFLTASTDPDPRTPAPGQIWMKFTP